MATSATEEAPTPALFDHAVRVYEEMVGRATLQTVDGLGEVKVYEGHLTRLFAELKIPNPYYTSIKKVLVAQDCMQQLRRGGGTALSKWVMLKPPMEESFRTAMRRKTGRTTRLDQLEQQVRDLRGVIRELVNDKERNELRLQVLEAAREKGSRK